MSNLLQYKVTTFTTPLTIHNRNITVLNKVPFQPWQLYNGVVLSYSNVWCEAKLIFVESGNKLYKLAARHKIGQWLSLSDFKTMTIPLLPSSTEIQKSLPWKLWQILLNIWFLHLLDIHINWSLLTKCPPSLWFLELCNVNILFLWLNAMEGNCKCKSTSIWLL